MICFMSCFIIITLSKYVFGTPKIILKIGSVIVCHHDMLEHSRIWWFMNKETKLNTVWAHWCYLTKADIPQTSWTLVEFQYSGISMVLQPYKHPNAGRFRVNFWLDRSSRCVLIVLIARPKCNFTSTDYKELSIKISYYVTLKLLTTKS